MEGEVSSYLVWMMLLLFVSVEKISQVLSWSVYGLYTTIAAFMLVTAFLALMAKSVSTIPNQFKNEWYLNFTKKMRRYSIAFIVLACIGVIIPNKKDLAIVIGGSVTWNVLTSEKSREFGGRIIDLLNDEIEKSIRGGFEQRLPKITSDAIEMVKGEQDVTN